MDEIIYEAMRGVPFVLINNYHKGLYSVDARPEPGMQKAFSYAYNLGHRFFGFITGDMRYRNAIDRLEAFIKISTEYEVHTKIIEGDFSKTSGYNGAEQLLSQNPSPSIIMTSSDRCACGVLQYASSHGIKIPQDLSVIGYDNLPPVTDINPPLSTIEHPVSLLASHATHLLIDILEGRQTKPIQVWLDTDFIVRESSSIYTNI